MPNRPSLFFYLLLLASVSCSSSPEDQHYRYSNGIGKPPPRVTENMDFQVHKLQSDLKSIGYDPGPCDGIIGPKTKSAVASFLEESPLCSSGMPKSAMHSAVYMQKTRMSGTEYCVPEFCGGIRKNGIYPADILFNPYIKGKQIQYGGVSALGDLPLTTFAISRYRSMTR